MAGKGCPLDWGGGGRAFFPWPWERGVAQVWDWNAFLPMQPEPDSS